MGIENELKNELDKINEKMSVAQKDFDDLSKITSDLSSSKQSLSEAADNSTILTNKLGTAVDNLDSIATSAKELYSILERTEASLKQTSTDSAEELSRVLNEILESNNKHRDEYSSLLNQKFSNLYLLIFFLVVIVLGAAYFVLR